MNTSAAGPDRQQIIKNIIDQYKKKEDNVIIAERLFMAITVVNWAFQQRTKLDSLQKYINYVHKFLNNEIDLYWQDGTIHYKPVKKRRS
jgi:hypothetical protein